MNPSLFLLQEPSPATVNQPFRVRLIMHTEDTSVNTVQATIAYNPEEMSVEAIDDHDSPISFWITPPTTTTSGGTTTGKILVSGIIPGGIDNSTSTLITCVFRPHHEGNFSLRLDDVSVLKNDGSGDPLPVSAEPLLLQVGKTPSEIIPPMQDTHPPEPFIPLLFQDPLTSKETWLIAFSTKDKESGMRDYEIAEQKSSSFFFRKSQPLSWKPAQSPFVLQDQKRESAIYVRAHDRAGNERTVIIPPLHDPTFSTREKIELGLLSLCLLLLVVSFFFYRIRLKRTSV